jgi:hypothetical protein
MEGEAKEEPRQWGRKEMLRKRRSGRPVDEGRGRGRGKGGRGRGHGEGGGGCSWSGTK